MTDTKVLPDAGRRKPPNAGKGRKKGVPNKLTGEVKAAILAAFEQAGGVEYLAKVAKKNPAVFCTLLGKVLPLQVTGPDGGAITVEVVKFASPASQ